METDTDMISAELRRWSLYSAGLGSMAWALVVGARWLGWASIGDPELLILLAVWLVSSLALPLIAASFPHDDRLLGSMVRIVLRAQPLAALLGGISLLLGQDAASASLATIWTLWTLITALAALMGILRLIRRKEFTLADACLGLALIYLPIGGLWLILASLGLRPLGFSAIIVTLTAAHFHFITLAALTMTGLTGKARRWARSSGSGILYRIAASGMLVTPLLVAMGITVTQLTGQHGLEATSAVILALSLIMISFLGLRDVVPTTTPVVARGLLAISYSTVVVTMALAMAYVLGPLTGLWALSISQMIATHAWLNALAFALCGLLGWWLREGTSRPSKVG